MLLPHSSALLGRTARLPGALRFPGRGLAEAGSGPGPSAVSSKCGTEEGRGAPPGNGCFPQRRPLCVLERARTMGVEERAVVVAKEGRAWGRVSCCRYGDGGSGERGSGGPAVGLEVAKTAGKGLPHP